MSKTDFVLAVQGELLIYPVGWDGFLDKILHETKLAMLDSACRQSLQWALERAEKQYDTFSERRRLEVERMAEAWCLGDLRSAADAVRPRRKLANSIRSDLENRSKP